MKFSISVITTVFASLAAATPQLVSSYDNVNSKETARIVARDSCDHVESSNVQSNEKPKEEFTMYYFETHRKAWWEMASLASEFNKMCDWNWLDLEVFQRNQEKWSAKLNEIENTYKGKLPGSYNSNNAIENLRSQYEAIKMANKVDKAMQEDGRPGSNEVSDLFELAARINSVYNLEGEPMATVSVLNQRISHLVNELQLTNNVVSKIRDMPQALKNFHYRQATKVAEQLDELKRKTQEKQKAQAEE